MRARRRELSLAIHGAPEQPDEHKKTFYSKHDCKFPNEYNFNNSDKRPVKKTKILETSYGSKTFTFFYANRGTAAANQEFCAKTLAELSDARKNLKKVL